MQLTEVAQLVILDTGHENDVVGAGGTSVPTEMYLGAGNDHVISGSKVSDIIYGGPGNDLIRSSGGDEFLHGGAGDDEIWGAGGVDTIEGDDGDDLLRGGNGGDTIGGGSGNDMINGDDGDDILNGGDGHDSLTGGSGCDTMDGGLGNDQDILMFSSLTAACISSVDILNVEYGLVDAMIELPALNYQQLLAWAGPGNTGHAQ